MGTGSSTSYGVPGNPRVEFASSRSRKENKIVRIDVPPLVNLQHGTLRYRYSDGHKPGEKWIEKPYEGTQLAEKTHYFYHQKYTGDAKGEPEWKYCYVYKGPECARQKQIYYVFGKGLKTNDNGFLESKYKPEEQIFDRPIFYKSHGHIYMELIFLKREVEPGDFPQKSQLPWHHPDVNSEKPDNSTLEQIKDIELCLPVEKQVLQIKVDLARMLVTLTAHIHLYLHSVELKDNCKLEDITKVNKGQTAVWVLLHPK